jgi:hypothetical protein
MSLGRLLKVDIREVWKSEANDFTPWLAQEENIRILGEEIGMELEIISREKQIGSFYADIHCKDIGSDKWVVIENQLEKTDHNHLGQLLTYTAGLQASSFVWIAKEFNEEHRAALDWLNQITADEYNFFGVEIQAWKIDNSPPAPKFQVVCKPNDWSRAIRDSTPKGLTTGQQLQLEYWNNFKDYLEKKGSPLKCSKPRPKNYAGFSIGRTGFNIAAVASTWDTELKVFSGELRAELYIFTGSLESSMAYFELLKSKRDEIEKKFGERMIWESAAERRYCRVYVRKPSDIKDRDKWEEQFGWLREKCELIDRIFKPIIKNLEIKPELEKIDS